MRIHGKYINKKGSAISVEIVSGGELMPVVEIGNDLAGDFGDIIYFDGTPGEIKSEINDTFDVLCPHSAVLRMQTRTLIPELFASDVLDVTVKIYEGEECLFAGYLLPMAYSQDFVEPYEVLELNCIDALSALQYPAYKDIGKAWMSYDEARLEAGQLTFADILTSELSRVGGPLGGLNIWYDGSRSLEGSDDPLDIFRKVSINDLLFLGEEEDDEWKSAEVVEEILRYLGLHAVQRGTDLYIYSWESIKKRRKITWLSLDGHGSKKETAVTTVISTDNVEGADAQISIGEVYNRISVTCDLSPVETLISSPLDDDEMEPVYTNRQLYMTEIFAGGDGKTAGHAFVDMCRDIPLTGDNKTYGGAVTRDNYLRIYRHPGWQFPAHNAGADTDLIEWLRTRPQQVPLYMTQWPAAMLMAWGSIENKLDERDNSVLPKIDMDNYLVVSVNGNGATDDMAFPDETTLRDFSPVARYVGNDSGGMFSPADDATTNYIVISGKLLLAPLNETTCPSFEYVRNTEFEDKYGVAGVYYHGNVVSIKIGDYDLGCYQQKWWRCDTPTSTPVYAPDLSGGGSGFGFVPPREGLPSSLTYNYSAIGGGTDTISKVGVLACMLRIGDKVCVETGTQGQPSDFEWRTFKPREECVDDDEYFAQTIAVGFDPKMGDDLIGKEFDIQNNIHFSMGLDTEGMAIPIRKADALSGKVSFEILGPYNLMWDNVTRRHRTFFRREKWGESSIPLLSKVQNIFVKDFEIEVVTDNGKLDIIDNDLVYTSDTDERYLNIKDDITMRISSALTDEERVALEVPANVNLNTPCDMTTGVGVLAIRDNVRGVTAKPEQLYVDECYREWHLPRVVLTIGMRRDRVGDGIADHYLHPALPGKEFFVQGTTIDLLEGSSSLQLKEIDND